MPSATHSSIRPILGLLTLAITVFSVGCLAVAGGTGAFAEEPLVISAQDTNIQGNDDRRADDDPATDQGLWLPSPRTLFHSTIHRAEEGRIELGDGSIIQIDSRHVLSSSVLLNQTYLRLARRGADIWIEDYGVFLGRVIQAPQRFIEEVPFHQCHVEKLIAGGRVLLTEDREVYEIDTFDQSHASRVLGPAVPLWVVENEIVLPLRSGGRIIEVVRHW